MNTASASLLGSPGVRLNPVYSASGAVLGTALVCAVLLWAFTYPLPNIPAHFMQLHLVAAPVSPPRRVAPSPPRHARVPTPEPLTQAVTAEPVVIPQVSPVNPAPLAPLDMSLPGLTFAPPAASAFVPHAFNAYSDLSHALNAPLPASTMQNGDAYRSMHGFPVVKSGGQCLALQSIQVGLSPSAHTTVGFGIPCPGEHRPSMADELKAWVAARASHKPRPPG